MDTPHLSGLTTRIHSVTAGTEPDPALSKPLPVHFQQAVLTLERTYYFIPSQRKAKIILWLKTLPDALVRPCALSVNIANSVKDQASTHHQNLRTWNTAMT